MVEYRRRGTKLACSLWVRNLKGSFGNIMLTD